MKRRGYPGGVSLTPQTWAVALAVAIGLSIAAAMTRASTYDGTAPPAPIAAVAPAAAFEPTLDEAKAIAMLRPRLHRRGFDSSVAGGPMLGLPPGEVTLEDFVGDDDTDLPVGQVQSAAWLISTNAGRWWVWEYGAAAPADRRAALLQAQTGQ
jgi:hypothetical protein